MPVLESLTSPRRFHGRCSAGSLPELGARSPFRAGACAALLVLAIVVLLGLALAHGLREGVVAAGGADRWSYSLWPYSFAGTRASWSITIAWPALLGLPALAFLVGTRSWRPRRPRPTHHHGSLGHE